MKNGMRVGVMVHYSGSMMVVRGTIQNWSQNGITLRDVKVTAPESMLPKGVVFIPFTAIMMVEEIVD